MTATQWNGVIGGTGALIIIMLLQSWLVTVARKRANNSREVRFMDLVVTCDDESYSLSRLQIYLWTVAVIIGFSAVFMAKGEIPDMPKTLYMLMGVNIASAVTSNAIRTARDLQRHVGSPPDFIKDIFFDFDGSIDLPRTQMAVWTIISLLAFLIMLVQSFVAVSPDKLVLPDITDGLVILMGLSNGAYLGAKATNPTPVEAANAAPPVVQQAVPPKIPPIAAK